MNAAERMSNINQSLHSYRWAHKIAVMFRAVYLTSIAMGSTIELAFCILLKHLPFIRQDPEAPGRILASMLERMGSTFIKLGQVLSSRPDLISNRMASPLARLRDHINPIPAETIKKIIEESFGVPLDGLFMQFTKDPIATGSIAQVHVAILKQGQMVAVKVQRPSLKIMMARDFAILRYVGWLLEHIPGFRTVPFRDVFWELQAAIQSQLDFEREANNVMKFQQNFKKRPLLRIPRLVPELCNRAVITMEYMSELMPADALQLPSASRRISAKAGLEVLYQMIFVDGLIHADLHPGNVLFRPNGEIIILDFGLVVSLENEVREQFCEFFFAMVTNQGTVCARIVQETAQSFAPTFDAVSYTEAMKAMVDRFAGRRVQEFEVAQFATALFALQRRFGIRGSTAFTMTIISLLVFEGILKVLDPEMDFQREALDFMLARKKPLDHQRMAFVFEASLDESNVSNAPNRLDSVSLPLWPLFY